MVVEFLVLVFLFVVLGVLEFVGFEFVGFEFVGFEFVQVLVQFLVQVLDFEFTLDLHLYYLIPHSVHPVILTLFLLYVLHTLQLLVRVLESSPESRY